VQVDVPSWKRQCTIGFAAAAAAAVVIDRSPFSVSLLRVEFYVVPPAAEEKRVGLKDKKKTWGAESRE
jgi:hypothetical protein